MSEKRLHAAAVAAADPPLLAEGGGETETTVEIEIDIEVEETGTTVETEIEVEETGTETETETGSETAAGTAEIGIPAPTRGVFLAERDSEIRIVDRLELIQLHQNHPLLEIQCCMASTLGR